MATTTIDALSTILSVMVKGVEALAAFPFLHSRKSSQKIPTKGRRTIRNHHPLFPMSCKRRIPMASEGMVRVSETIVNSQP